MDQLTFLFTDLDDGDDTTVIVRGVEGGVGLAVSKRNGGDVETFVPIAEAYRIADALRAASQ
jgi:hypothetical protein